MELIKNVGEAKKFNFSAVEHVANKTHTSEEIFLDLSSRQRFRKETDLNRYYIKLMNKGAKVVKDDYMATWKELETLGLGSIVYGRKGKPNRFMWHYNLKWVGKAGIEGEKAGNPVSVNVPDKVEPLAPIKRRGRPKGYKVIRKAAPVKTNKELSLAITEQVLKIMKEVELVVKYANELQKSA